MTLPHVEHAAYERIAETLRTRLTDRAALPGGRLPSEAALAKEFSVARGTVRRALSELEGQGLVVTRAGRGRWVAGAVATSASLGAVQGAVAEKVRSAIRSGAYKSGERLPGELSLAAELGVARVTLRRALESLEREGLLVTRPRSGRYVAEDERTSSRARGTGDPA